MAGLRILLLVSLTGLVMTRIDFFGHPPVAEMLEPGQSGPGDEVRESMDASRTGSQVFRPAIVPREARPEPASLPLADSPERISADDSQLSLSGRVGTEFGAPVGGEKVVLYSPSNKTYYTTTTSDSGEYRFMDIEPGRDYVLNISPREIFENYTRSKIILSSGQEVRDVVLNPVPLGILSGAIVDPYQRPVAGIELLVTATEKEYQTIRAVTDASGNFSVTDFPKGKFQLAIKGEQTMKATGLNFDPATNLAVTLTIDQGPYLVEGGIYDESGQTFDGADVYLVWALHENGVSIRSTRKTSADSSGTFSFTGLGPGKHELVVSAWRGGTVKKSVKRAVDVGVDSGELLVVIDTYR